MFYFITIDGKFAINYKFHSIEIDIWKEVVLIHTKGIKNWWIEDKNSELIKWEEIPEKKYYDLTIKSDNYILYLNINYLFYLSEDRNDISKDTKIINRIIKENTWER